MESLSGKEYYYKLDNMDLTSCQLLRKLFQARWKNTTGKDWEHTKEQGKAFIESEEAKKVIANAQAIQKKMIEKRGLQDWDFSLPSRVLQNCGNPSECEKEAVKALTKLRNDLAHHPTKKLSLNDYNAKN